jgi:hypothetical protein
MVRTRYVNEVKVKGEDGDYPPVDTSAGGDFDIPSTTRFRTPMK